MLSCVVLVFFFVCLRNAFMFFELLLNSMHHRNCFVAVGSYGPIFWSILKLWKVKKVHITLGTLNFTNGVCFDSPVLPFFGMKLIEIKQKAIDSVILLQRKRNVGSGSLSWLMEACRPIHVYSLSSELTAGDFSWYMVCLCEQNGLMCIGVIIFGFHSSGNCWTAFTYYTHVREL